MINDSCIVSNIKVPEFASDLFILGEIVEPIQLTIIEMFSILL